MKRKFEIVSELKRNALAVLLNVLQHSIENNKNLTDDNNYLLSENENEADKE